MARFQLCMNDLRRYCDNTVLGQVSAILCYSVEMSKYLPLLIRCTVCRESPAESETVALVELQPCLDMRTQISQTLALWSNHQSHH